MKFNAEEIKRKLEEAVPNNYGEWFRKGFERNKNEQIIEQICKQIEASNLLIGDK